MGFTGVMAPLSGFKSPTRRTRQCDHSQTGTSRESYNGHGTRQRGYGARRYRGTTGVAKPPTPEVRPLIPQDDSGGSTAFALIKDLLSKSSQLVIMNEQDPLILYTDASTRAIGGVLMQIQDGIEKPVIFVSHVLSDQATRRGIMEIEL